MSTKPIEILINKNILFKIRAYLVLGFISIFSFYYIMMAANPNGTDDIFVRSTVGGIILFNFILTFFITNIRLQVICYNFSSAFFILGYVYLLHINEWSVFYRWAYFVVGVVLTTVAVTWGSYIFLTLLTLLAPLAASLISPLNILELIHFHSSNLIIYIVVGVSVRSFFTLRQQLVDLNYQMTSSSQLTALGKLSGGVAHEINNPLTIVNGYLLRIKKHKDKIGEPDSLLFDKIDLGLKRIQEIVESLKKFSSPDRDNQKVVKISLKIVVDDIVNLNFNRMEQSHIQFENNLNEIEVMGVENDIQLAIMHVFNNAVDVLQNFLGQKTIEISQRTEDGYNVLIVMDSGPGIPQEIESSLMKPFNTTKDIGMGKGLGLSISYGIMKSTGGKLVYLRKEGKTFFEFYFPQKTLS